MLKKNCCGAVGLIVIATTACLHADKPFLDGTQFLNRLVALVVAKPGSHQEQVIAGEPAQWVVVQCGPDGRLRGSAENPNTNQEFNPRKLIPPVRAIKDIPVQSVTQANQTLGAAELVLGVEVSGRARAYPISMLCGPQREIINDRVGDLAVAATW